MVTQVPLSQSGPAAAFAASLEAYCADLEAHRAGPAGFAAPTAHPLLDSLVKRVPRGDPLPDAFELLPYEIFDDTPPPPTLQDKQAALLADLVTAAKATRDAILSPARVNLLNISAGEAMSVTEETRTPDQVAAIAAYVAFQARLNEINTNAAHAAVEIEELDDAGVASWKVPSL